MAGEKRGLYYHDHYHFLREFNDYPFHSELSSVLLTHKPAGSSLSNELSSIVDPPTPYVGLTDCLNGSTEYYAFPRPIHLPSSSADAFALHGSTVKREPAVMDTNNYGHVSRSLTTISATVSAGGDGAVGTVTPISSVSSSSSEAAGEEDSERCNQDDLKQQVEEEEEEEEKQPDKRSEEGGDKPKKVMKPKNNKAEKRQRQPRFAFMTKSEVDLLEDGYRWRKYGQKAVKNSPYPRSYYRCTTQNCSVKKRVERSYQDPAIVITSYEGKHTHQTPATVRGSMHILAPPPMLPTSFGWDLLMPQAPIGSTNTSQQVNTNPNINLPSLPHFQQFQFKDYGLLQDIVPAFMQKNQP